MIEMASPYNIHWFNWSSTAPERLTSVALVLPQANFQFLSRGRGYVLRANLS